jgi:hypothetical protein
MNTKKIFRVIVFLAFISITNKNFSMDVTKFFASKFTEALVNSKIAGERLSEVESAKIFFGVALSALLFDYAQNLVLSKINPKFYKIEKKDTWDIKLYKPFKESLSATYLTNLSLGLGALACGYLFNANQLKFVDMVKPGALLLTGITVASIGTSLSHYKSSIPKDFSLNFDKIANLIKSSSRVNLSTAACLLPVALMYCR